jgi:hypothetical protein
MVLYIKIFYIILSTSILFPLCVKAQREYILDEGLLSSMSVNNKFKILNKSNLYLKLHYSSKKKILFSNPLVIKIMLSLKVITKML